MTPIEFLAHVLRHVDSQPNGWITCTRSDLTRAFCHHPRRSGSLTTADLDRLLPRLIQAGVACEFPRPGKPPALIIRPITSGELLARTQVVNKARDSYFAEHPNPMDRAALTEWISREANVLRTLGPKGQTPELLDPIEKLTARCSTTT